MTPVTLMKLVRQHAVKLLCTLEATLWIAGCCALLYCIVSVGDALITQMRLTGIFERTRSIGVKPAGLGNTARPVTSSLAKPAFIPTKKAEPLGLLDIPRIGVSAMVLEGIGSRTLRVGLGHFPATSGPGQPGNVAIAGHRDTFFRPLRDIKPGDEVVFKTPTQDYHYRVSSVEVVDPADIAVLKSQQQDELTLVTCYPFSYLGAAPKRFIVHAVLAR